MSRQPSDMLPAESPRGPINSRIPDGDNRPRLVCDECGFIHYENPKIVVGAVCLHEDKLLLCRRAIHPRRGYWTLPAGYLELNESTEAGAAREAREEALAEIAIDRLLAVYSIPRISQVQLIYRARLARPDFGVGEESLEVALFGWDDIPWDDIAFPSVHWALAHYRETAHLADFPPFGNPPGATGNY
ncbi:NUDIX hydrolase [Oceanibaculum pacificum]|uniref:NUDIX hydrolase n=2 Tax=Oceanibaculum pacificum TaxID=580166 RepID=A0A154VKT6_9PROT|nr:NUDIX hydrolase [Oceanibaculum pacificum]